MEKIAILREHKAPKPAFKVSDVTDELQKIAQIKERVIIAVSLTLLSTILGFGVMVMYMVACYTPTKSHSTTTTSSSIVNDDIVDTTVNVNSSKIPHIRRARKERKELYYISSIIKTIKMTKDDTSKLAFSIVKRAKQNNYNPLFVASVIKHESTFKPHVVSNVGAIGLMQLLPNTGKYISEKAGIKWNGSKKLYEADYNIQLGISYLKYLEDKFNGNMELALIAYNWGPGNVNKALAGRKNIPSSPKHYAKSILQTQAKWENNFNA